MAGPFVIALPTLWPWSARGIVTNKLTYMPWRNSATTSTRTARLPRRTRARLAGAAVLTGRAADLASKLICLTFLLVASGPLVQTRTYGPPGSYAWRGGRGIQRGTRRRYSR